MSEVQSNFRPGMLMLGCVFAAWTVYGYMEASDQKEPSYLGVVMLALAAVLCFLRARRTV